MCVIGKAKIEIRIAAPVSNVVSTILQK